MIDVTLTKILYLYSEFAYHVQLHKFTPWISPPIQTWNVKADCALHAEVASRIWKSAANDSCSLDVDALHEYVLSSLPANISRPTRQQAALWYLATYHVAGGRLHDDCDRHGPDGRDCLRIVGRADVPKRSSTLRWRCS